MDVLAIVHSLFLFISKGHTEQLEQTTALFIRCCGGHDGNFHATNFIDFINLNFWEDELLPQTDGIVPATIKRVGKPHGSHGYGAKPR